jgi:hypothetical protein
MKWKQASAKYRKDIARAFDCGHTGDAGRSTRTAR